MIEIIHVTRSEEALVITVKKRPGLFAQLFGIKPKTTTYRGHDESWYDAKTGRPALKEVAQLLKSLHNTLHVQESI